MITVQETATIDRPPAEVFALAADPEQQLRWDAGTLRSVEKLSAGPLGLGARYRGNFKGFGVVDYEFVDYQPPERFTHRAVIRLGEMRHTFVFEAVPEGTRMTQVGQLVPTVLGRVMAPLVQLMLRRRFRLIADELRRAQDVGRPS